MGKSSYAAHIMSDKVEGERDGGNFKEVSSRTRKMVLKMALMVFGIEKLGIIAQV